MSPYKNVTVAGASGSVGSKILAALIAADKFIITVLTRKESKATFPSSVHVIKVDYESVESLTAALKNQEVVIATLTTMESGVQKILIDAAVAAGIKRFIPGEFGSNLENPKTRVLPVFKTKIEIADYLEEKVKEHPTMTYTNVVNNAFLDWGLQQEFIFNYSDFKPRIYDGGNWKFSTTTLTSVADAVVGILNHPEETANRNVCIHDMLLSQNEIFAIAKRLTPGQTWEPVNLSLADLVAESNKKLAAGDFGFETFTPYIWQACMAEGFGNDFHHVDNELLGVKGKTLADVEAILKPLLLKK